MTALSCPCGKPLGRRNTSGRCRTCFNIGMNSLPERRAKASASLRARYSDPEQRARQSEATRAGIARYMATPGAIERKREIGRLHGAKNIEATRSPEIRAKAGMAISAARMAHVPPSMRTAYRELMATKQWTAAEALEKLHNDVREEVERRGREGRRKHARDVAQRY